MTRLFEAVGSTSWVEHEGLLDTVTALSGSGPAYYQLFSEALSAAGVALGLSPELARTLARPHIPVHKHSHASPESPGQRAAGRTPKLLHLTDVHSL
ncbi:pyrroline-5-carboxylate reductase dimerization domain-containing protein [Pseudomonas putida]|uniref:Pyrroline-5-carboxylate reductase-like protein n=1 Tax=Pseudomonas putida (strain W619) TaxID=390235 RepID=B1JA13_PSEPW|nr:MULTISPECIES: pyrroline-5-carboxylate reductase dimerization domain-containing protein [Pseudomonas]MDH1574765.1 hypothetical protein [Pseudomonas sp. GD03746]